MSASSSPSHAQTLYPAHQIHKPLPYPQQLTSDHLHFYQTQGFLAFENVFSPADIALAKDRLALLVQQPNPPYHLEFELNVDPATLPAEKRLDHVRKLMLFCPHDPPMNTHAQHPRLLAIVEKLLASSVVMIQDMALLKPPNIGREKPWHQDAAYFRMDPPDLVIGTWIALDPATPENGCMNVIPGSHLAGPQPHYHDRDCQLPDDTINTARNLVIPLTPGSALFFHSLLHHGTPPNSSSARRRAVQFHYASTKCTKTTSADHAALFHDPVGYAGCQPARPIAQRP